MHLKHNSGRKNLENKACTILATHLSLSLSFSFLLPPEYESEPEASEFDLGTKISTPKDVMLEELSLLKNKGSKMFKMRQLRVERFIYENNPDVFNADSIVGIIMLQSTHHVPIVFICAPLNIFICFSRITSKSLSLALGAKWWMLVDIWLVHILLVDR